MTSHCTSLADVRREHRRVADEGAAVDRLELAHRREDDLELAVGRALVAAEDRQHPVHAAGDRLVHRRRVVVVGPDARRVAAPPCSRYVHVCAGLDVGVAAREAGQVGAVRARLVADAVEVHRVRAPEARVEVLEVHEDAVADARAQQRAGDQVLVARARRGVGAAAASSRACSGGRRPSGTRSATGRSACPVIASRPLGTMFHVTGHGGDPVLADRRGRGAGRRRRAPPPPARGRPRAWPRALSLHGDRPVHERVDHAVELVRAPARERHRARARQRRRRRRVHHAAVPEPVAVQRRASAPPSRAAARSGRPPRGSNGPAPWNDAAIWPRYEAGSVSGLPGPERRGVVLGRAGRHPERSVVPAGTVTFPGTIP